MATEKRLIDANALIKDWNELTKRMVRDADGKIPVDFGLVIRELNKTPTVDAVEVVHGRWIPSHSKCDCTCSVCNTEFDNIVNDTLEDWDYCPNCGAKMDGGADNGL